MKLKNHLLCLLIFGVSCFPPDCRAADIGVRSIGARIGISATELDNFFHQYEGSVVLQLPWELRNHAGWGVSTQLDMLAGVLHDEGHSGFIGAVGPAFRFGKQGFPVEMDLGFSPAFISRDTFGNRDYNGTLQFISHVGIDFRLGSKLGVGYRLQHMSNGSLNGGPNPGLNMHLLELNWYFRQ
jgi:hypothetical protein